MRGRTDFANGANGANSANFAVFSDFADFDSFKSFEWGKGNRGKGERGKGSKRVSGASGVSGVSSWFARYRLGQFRRCYPPISVALVYSTNGKSSNFFVACYFSKFSIFSIKCLSYASK